MKHFNVQIGICEHARFADGICRLLPRGGGRSSDIYLCNGKAVSGAIFVSVIPRLEYRSIRSGHNWYKLGDDPNKQISSV